MKNAGEMIVFFNGSFARKDDVRISPDDRGFLFADDIYDVIRIYGGRLFRAEDHYRRMARSLRALGIDGPPPETFGEVAEELMRANDLRDAAFYIQITRGAAPRKHAFPNPSATPTVYAALSPPTPNARQLQDGVGVLLVPDLRWARCDIKAVALLPNVLANQRAKESGAEEAVFVRDGVVTEGSHTNVAAVIDGRLRTYPASNYVLPGVTRAVVLELCAALHLPFREEGVLEDDFRKADEVMLLGTSSEVMPVVRIDGQPVGDGRPGPVTRRLQQAFRECTCAD